MAEKQAVSTGAAAAATAATATSGQGPEQGAPLEAPPPYTPGEYGKMYQPAAPPYSCNNQQLRYNPQCYNPNPPAFGQIPPQPGYPAQPSNWMPPAAAPIPVGEVPNTTMFITHVQCLGPVSATLQCPACQATVLTSVETAPGSAAWLTSLVCCVFGCWWGCCLIPFCIPEMQDVKHSCPNCRHHIGTYRRL
ncbi:PREDICTED: lipopolysaccharide-induced tumor necrosis factor-alpha factor homolog isoform X1 [Priapulus caudatus]|uniref:Lipopolysaccharide-induced tumor necrosis factor-alpha factor homolog isoform X1 n=1 Tax=Priapulus caudatus TaxID=37621 RepID=A0ABM1EJT4_PRICU|nr:PREDICTED: lipopolysaccharide-induced tumor necrosis factor-alpha factor homolog isoform X1 [Priapulus caudatus]XP_014672455.1 PREDICTED: lipopolysaccharide-induced tumor necrosis factor-alpha factor homolog isoform X1 [Priapulus caudatus]